MYVAQRLNPKRVLTEKNVIVHTPYQAKILKSLHFIIPKLKLGIYALTIWNQ